MAAKKISSNIITSIGNTPLIDVSQLSPDPKIQIFGKLESANPTGSVKDRVAKYLILNAEREGKISEGSTILEPTSGNTGIGLAMLGSTRGYKIKVVMPADVPPERIDILKAFGAEVIFSDAGKGTNESINLAQKIKNELDSKIKKYGKKSHDLLDSLEFILSRKF